jgi:hypothetical protein
MILPVQKMLLILLVAGTWTPCAAIETGFYTNSEVLRSYDASAKPLAELTKLDSEAERHLTIENDLDEIDIGLKKGGKPLLFTRAELAGWLKGEKHKEFVSVTFGRRIMSRGQTYRDAIVRAMLNYLEEIGYQHILFQGTHFQGAFVLKDWYRRPDLVLDYFKPTGGNVTEAQLDWFKYNNPAPSRDTSDHTAGN